ncbi:DUF1479-domain-containing protein [Cristinia sonorae]|uniref:DUF1479-domain-containing protein n=1 Tax=Cristinia sonorae TaxID=1940300 RepID=A0A8K0UT21_9AGAR|nr:DUF1479-domain-containing protein [Cristinia sonorae]
MSWSFVSAGSRILSTRASGGRTPRWISTADASFETSSPPILDSKHAASSRLPKRAGTIEDVFSTSLADVPPLPQRFLSLKKQLFRQDLIKSWNDVLTGLQGVTEEAISRGQAIIPSVQYSDIVNGLSAKQIKDIKRTGSVIVRGGVPVEEALQWKKEVREYAAMNKELVRGSPADKIVFYELYYSKAQLAARTHPAVINTQRALLSLWHVSDPMSAVSLNTPISYFDRLRIRPPGPSVFTLGPHIDSGGLERWEDPGFRQCFSKILEGNWRQHDPFDASPRLNAKQDLYDAPSQCSIFRPWQGWTSLSSTGPSEGTLRLLPFLPLSSAYIMLRPFFRPKRLLQTGEAPLAAEDWELDLESTAFPGSEMAKAQGLNEMTHPHLRLDKAMVSIPRVEPGDQVYWHCDLVHSVEAKHTGDSDSSVFCIPAAPLTVNNMSYLQSQTTNFHAGTPPPDFGGGDGESRFEGRGTPEDIISLEGRRISGLTEFSIPPNATSGEIELINQVNAQLYQERR